MRPIKPFFRQIHLDFHTSEHCDGVGEQFDEDQFIGALRLGHVDSINYFAMGHHGWCYYPTELGLAHPHLKTDLVGRMTDACKKAGIQPVIYITVGWNDKASREHPDWCVRNPDGTIDGPPAMHPHPARSWGWHRLCFNSPYLDEVVLPVTREVMDRYKPAGIWFDITGEYVCTCNWCLEGMKNEGINPEDPTGLTQWAQIVYKQYLEKTTEAVWGANPDAIVYHNGTDLKGRYDLYSYWSHYEIESLPTGGWGYNHFPVNARYYTRLRDTTVVSMTGKFHKSWGEFGGFKNPIALRYEMAQIMSLGCLACVGDQLHPAGEMDMETYRIVGEAYKDVEDREPWLVGARPVADVAVLSPSAVLKESTREDESEAGASRMLMEMHIPHAVIDSEMDFSPYRLLIMPDRIPVDEELSRKLSGFLDSGGSLILSGTSGVNPEGSQFMLDLGAVYQGDSPWDVEFIKVRDGILKNMVRSPFLVYEGGQSVKVKDAEILADTWRPYFNRTYEHFCSHRNTPPKEPAGWPAVIRKNQVIYISQPIFRSYQQQGMQLHRDLVANCIDLLYNNRLLTADLPSCGRASVTYQPEENRYMIHLLYAAPIRRGQTEVIEDILPLLNVKAAFQSVSEPKRVYIAPVQQELQYRYQDGKIEFTVPVIELATIVVIEV